MIFHSRGLGLMSPWTLSTTILSSREDSLLAESSDGIVDFLLSEVFPRRAHSSRDGAGIFFGGLPGLQYEQYRSQLLQFPDRILCCPDSVDELFRVCQFALQAVVQIPII